MNIPGTRASLDIARKIQRIGERGNERFFAKYAFIRGEEVHTTELASYFRWLKPRRVELTHTVHTRTPGSRDSLMI